MRLVLGSCKQRRLLAEDDDAHLDKAQEIIIRMGPLLEVGQVDLAAGVHVLAHLDLHVSCGLHKGHGGVIGMGVQQDQ